MSSIRQQLRTGRARTVGLTFAVGALVLGYGGTAVQAQSAAPAAGDVYTVNAVTTDLGTFLTGEDGKTLYFFAQGHLARRQRVHRWVRRQLAGVQAGRDRVGRGGHGRHGRARHVPARGRLDAGQLRRATAVLLRGGRGRGRCQRPGPQPGVVRGSGRWHAGDLRHHPPQGATVYTVNAVTTDLGTFLTGEDGKTLYYFLKDTSPGASACTGGCSDNWPSFVLEGTESVAAGTGVTGVLGTFARADGSMQVTYDGRPLYYFVGDAAAGDVNGQGLNQVWYVAAADGMPVAPAASTAP